jgi:hypothetical protein
VISTGCPVNGLLSHCHQPPPKKRCVGRPVKNKTITSDAGSSSDHTTQQPPVSQDDVPNNNTVKDSEDSETGISSSLVAEVSPPIDCESTASAGSEPPVMSSPSIRGKYKSYTISEKAIVDEARERGIWVTASDHHIAPSTIVTWMKTDFSQVQSTKRGARKAGGGRKVTIGVDNDEKIPKWILKQRFA